MLFLINIPRLSLAAGLAGECKHLPLQIRSRQKGVRMNIQIFGTNKSFDTKKAQRWFKERGIKFQMIDLVQKGMSKGELDSVLKAVGGLDNLLDQKSKSYASLAYLAYDEDKKEKLLEDGTLMKTPIVRNGRQATVGYQPDVWEQWE